MTRSDDESRLQRGEQAQRKSGAGNAPDAAHEGRDADVLREATKQRQVDAFIAQSSEGDVKSWRVTDHEIRTGTHERAELVFAVLIQAGCDFQATSPAVVHRDEVEAIEMAPITDRQN